MSNMSLIISEINTFISNKNDLDYDTIGFLTNLKEKLLELQDASVLIHTQNKKQKQLPKVETFLRAVGKEAFINCYKSFKDKHIGIKNNIVKDMFICAGAKTDNSARTKASIGSKIFNEGLHIEALKNIIDSNRVDIRIREKAKTILNKEIVLDNQGYGGESKYTKLNTGAVTAQGKKNAVAVVDGSFPGFSIFGGDLHLVMYALVMGMLYVKNVRRLI